MTSQRADLRTVCFSTLSAQANKINDGLPSQSIVFLNNTGPLKDILFLNGICMTCLSVVHQSQEMLFRSAPLKEKQLKVAAGTLVCTLLQTDTATPRNFANKHCPFKF